MPDSSGAALAAAREDARPPRDDLVRAACAGVALRADAAPTAEATTTAPEPAERADAEPVGDGDDAAARDGMPTLFGHFTPFNRWTEIDSFYEGNFLERIAPGAFKKTFREQTPKVLFQHGMDPQVGDKPLGIPATLREDEEGPYYEVPLLDTSYNRDLVPGLEAGAYGASFRFSVMREDFVLEPEVSEDNPKGLPERTIREARVSEFGPVTFPAYADATAGVRSLTDEFIIGRATCQPERLRALLDYLTDRDARALSTTTAAPVLGNAAPAVTATGTTTGTGTTGTVVYTTTTATTTATADAEPVVTPTATTEPDTAPVDTAAARAVEESENDESPGSDPTTLYFGRRYAKAAPGRGPTPLYTGQKHKSERWCP